MRWNAGLLLIACTLLLMLVLNSIASSEVYHLELEAYYEDFEIGRVESILVNDSIVYAIGSRDSYVNIASYYANGSGRLWFKSINLGGNVTILNSYIDESYINIIAYSRRLGNTSIYIVKIPLANGKVNVEYYSSMYPRLYPTRAVSIGESIYVSGSSFIVGYDYDYMVARVSRSGVDWVREDYSILGRGEFKCVMRAPGDRIMAIGDNRSIVLISILSQLGDTIADYSLRFNNLTVSILDCSKVSSDSYIIVGAINVFPLIILVKINSLSKIEDVRYLIINNTIGLATSATYVKGLAIVYIITGSNSNLLSVYSLNNNDLNLLAVYNITKYTGGNAIALASASQEHRVAIGGVRENKGFIIILNLTREEVKIPSIPGLHILEDLRLTIGLVIVILTLLAYAVYKRGGLKRGGSTEQQSGLKSD
ncbi:MAG: hypothetical protein QXJ33_03520 [Acidilobaceae archaeon]